MDEQGMKIKFCQIPQEWNREADRLALLPGRIPDKFIDITSVCLFDDLLQELMQGRIPKLTTPLIRGVV
jgi:hypothetical protein